MSYPIDIEICSLNRLRGMVASQQQQQFPLPSWERIKERGEFKRMAGLNALQGVLRCRRSSFDTESQDEVQDRGKSLQDQPCPMIVWEAFDPHPVPLPEGEGTQGVSVLLHRQLGGKGRLQQQPGLTSVNRGNEKNKNKPQNPLKALFPGIADCNLLKHSIRTNRPNLESKCRKRREPTVGSGCPPQRASVTPNQSCRSGCDPAHGERATRQSPVNRGNEKNEKKAQNPLKALFPGIADCKLLKHIIQTNRRNPESNRRKRPEPGVGLSGSPSDSPTYGLYTFPEKERKVCYPPPVLENLVNGMTREAEKTYSPPDG